VNVPTPPKATFSLTCSYLVCTFADQSTAGTAALSERAWSFGDGGESTEATGTHTFAAAGTYLVRLIVRDAAGLSDSETTTVSVRPPNVPPTASFTSSCVDLTCTFTDTSTDSDGQITSWNWSFGDGTSTEAAPSFKFAAPGSYQVSLTVTDNDGATATTTATVNVTALIHVAFVSGTITSGNGQGKSSWRVSANVAVHGADERAIAGATINATWNGAKTISCVTDTDGQCTFNTGTVSASKTSVTLTVLGVSAPLSVYQTGVNHDGAGNPTGTSVTYIKP